MLNKYICVHLNNRNTTRNCKTCNGITSLCGKYTNKAGISFDAVKRKVDGYYYEVLTHDGHRDYLSKLEEVIFK